MHPVGLFESNGHGRDTAVRVGAKTGKLWRRGAPVPREPSTAEDGGAVDTLRITRSVRRADLKAVGEVRRALRELMRHRCRTEATDVAELLITELVTNALVHTDRGAEVSASLTAARLRVEVRDHAARRPRPYVPTADDGTHGRGLVLVEALADEWGVDALALGGGKVVWFELDGRCEAPYAAGPA
ncbi:ATP-binding protein [Streptomyces erythrochromogenes]|uniref:ATP-binding protein n=1 Tax=Streptomyces erythrochromogenes TaxID=285574 RepID=UPI0036AFB204